MSTPNFSAMGSFDDPYQHIDPFAKGIRHLYSAKQFLDHKLLTTILDRADVIKEQVETGMEVDTPIRSNGLHRKKHMHIMFVNSPSTRTIRSTERAAMLLGMTTAVEQDANFSSMGKGETWEHTVAALSAMLPDVLSIRTSEQDLVPRAMQISSVPVINCGNGKAGEHPTQMLGDQFLIRNKLKRLNNLKIVIVGDMRNHRVIRSNLIMWSSFPDNSFEFFSPKKLSLAADIKTHLDNVKAKYKEYHDGKHLPSALAKADIVYVIPDADHALTTGREKYLTEADLDDFVIDWKVADLMKTESIIMHPLPAGGEIRPRLDYHPRCAYVPQPGLRDINNEMTLGVIARMAALEWVFGYLG